MIVGWGVVMIEEREKYERYVGYVRYGTGGGWRHRITYLLFYVLSMLKR